MVVSVIHNILSLGNAVGENNGRSMQDVKIKKGYRHRMVGAPSTELVHLPDPARVAFLPEKIPHIKPRLEVAVGDEVNVGSILFYDKRNPAIKFASPAGGVVSAIQLGPRRVVEAIVIEIDPKGETHVRFQTIPDAELATINRDQLVDHILNGGLWWIFRQLPFRDLPNPYNSPPTIIVCLSADDPFQPVPGVYLKDRLELLRYGLKALKALSRSRVIVLCHADTPPPAEVLPLLTHQVRGNYPSDDPGTFLYHIKTSTFENPSWFISGQDLMLLAQFLTSGAYPVDRIVSVAGSSAHEPRHYKTRLGAPLSHLVDGDALDDDVQYVAGGLFRGYRSDRQGFMGHYETGLNLVPAGNSKAFLALFNPGHRKPTYSRLFLSRLSRRPLHYDCNLNGGERACIACLHCADVCPVDILPHMTYKAVLADEVEASLEHGLLDCVDCGLCAYVCPSKIELTQTFSEAKAAYAKEQGP